MRGTCNSDLNICCSDSSNLNTRAVTTAVHLFLWLKLGNLWKWAISNLCKTSQNICSFWYNPTNNRMFRWNGWFYFLLRHCSLYISKLELVTCLCSEAVYVLNYCVTFFQPEEYEFLQNNARSPEFLKTVNMVNTLLFLYVVKKGSLFKYCLFLTEYARFIYLYFFYKFEKKNLNLPVTGAALLNSGTGVVSFSFFIFNLLLMM